MPLARACTPYAPVYAFSAYAGARVTPDWNEAFAPS
jgi:hypothetical protein